MEAELIAAAGFSLEAADPSHVGAARSAIQRMARALGFDETRSGRVAIVVTEAVTNMLKHAGGGTLAARSVAQGGSIGLEVLAIDSGPGMHDLEASARDGHSTAGTAGTGLGAIRRLSDSFEAYSRAGIGTILRSVSWDREPVGERPTHEVGAVCIPKPGETVCGDAWEVAFHPRGATFLVADGLGHGPDASRAASTAVEALRRHAGDTAIRILDAAHARLRPTRGAAVAVIRHDLVQGQADFAGVGNIAGVLLHGTERRAMVSHSGIVGHNVHKSMEYRYEWARDTLMVVHSDGLESQWDLKSFPGLDACHPSIIAAALYRKHSRRRDDCTVVVARA